MKNVHVRCALCAVRCALCIVRSMFTYVIQMMLLPRNSLCMLRNLSYLNALFCLWLHNRNANEHTAHFIHSFIHSTGHWTYCRSIECINTLNATYAKCTNIQYTLRTLYYTVHEHQIKHKLTD